MVDMVGGGDSAKILLDVAEFHEGIVEAKLSKNFCMKIPLPGNY